MCVFFLCAISTPLFTREARRVFFRRLLYKCLSLGSTYTYRPQGERPTDRPMVSNYTSIRITIPHRDLVIMLEKVFYDVSWYICYPHTGKNGDNEHFHVFCPATDNAGRDRLRKRVKDHFGSGNKFVSLKHCENGITQAIQYGSKEGTSPITRGDVQSWIDNAPPWIPGGTATKKRKRNRTQYDSDGEYEAPIIVNKYNIDDLAVRFYKRKKLDYPCKTAWRRTIIDMIASKKFSFKFSEKLDGIYEFNFLCAIGLELPESLANRMLGFDFSEPE